MFFYVCVEVVQSRTVEFPYLLESLFEFDEFEFGEVFVEVFGDGFAGRFEDRVPVVAVVVPWEW